MFFQTWQKSLALLVVFVVFALTGACSQVPEPTSEGKASITGVSTADLVSTGEKLGPDGKKDIAITLSLVAGGKVTSMRVNNYNGQPALWDTVPANAVWMLGVATKESPQTLLNMPDGTISIDMDKLKDFVLYFADNGAVTGGRTDFEVKVTYDDGTTKKIPVTR